MTGSGYWERVAGWRIGRRKALGAAAGAGLGIAAVSLAGCGGGDGEKAKGVIDDPNAIIYAWQRPDETKGAVPGGIYRSFTSIDITGTLDPMASSSFTTQSPAGAAYETMLWANSGPGIDPRSAEGRKIIGGLAESFEVSGDAVSFTFRLRPGVKFHPIAPVNGRAMDIDDWRTSYERYKAVSPFRANLNEIVDRVDYPDARTMVFKMKYPYVPFVRLMVSGTASFYVLPKELNQNPDVAARTLAGTSYRSIDKIQPAVAREYKKWEQYWAGSPFIDRWHFPIIPEYANQMAQFIVGNVIDFTPRQTDVLQVRKDAAGARMFKGDPGGGYRTNFFGFKEFETSPWRDERVRIALRMGVDWDKVRAYFANTDEFAVAGLPTESRLPTHVKAGGSAYAYWLDPQRDQLGEASKNFLFNASEAKRLLSAAGFPNGFEIDGYMNGGTEYGTSVYPELVQIHMDQWAQNINVRVKLNRPPYADFLPNIYQKREYKGICLEQPEFTYNEIDLELFNWYHAKGSRFKSIEDSKVEGFIERQRKELDEEKRTAIIHDLQKYMATKMYTIPGDGVSSGFGFAWPWVRNAAHRGHLEWLDPNMPRRSG